ncbi:ribonuclease inhibitor, partial [Mycobacterium tuberculosis]|nr:ribonuclease inhibitor [Mycobacterium tuberculosis]
MKTYRGDGSKVSSKADFFAELGRAVNGDDGYFGSN